MSELFEAKMATTETVQTPPTDTPAATRAPGDGTFVASLGIRLGAKYGLIALVGILIVFFSVYPTTGAVFTSSANWRALFGSQAVVLLTALAFTVPLVASEYDLSVGGIAVISSVVLAGLVGGQSVPITGIAHLPVWLGVIIVMLLGAGIGAVNGTLVVRGVDSLVATLGTSIVLAGIVTWYSHGQGIFIGMPQGLNTFGTKSLGFMPLAALISLVVGVALWYVLEHTPFGRRLYAIGSNRAAARLVGIRVRRSVMTSFILAGVIASLAGIILTARQGGGVPVNGLDLVLPGFAASFLGRTTLRPGRYNVFGTMFGLLFVAVSVSGLSLLGVDVWIHPVFSGTSLVLAVLIGGFFHARLSGRRASL